METWIRALAHRDLLFVSSPFGGIPRNWKLQCLENEGERSRFVVPPSGGSLEIGNEKIKSELGTADLMSCSPFGGIPRNWKLEVPLTVVSTAELGVPPSGGSLEIGNFLPESLYEYYSNVCSPFGGIPRNWKQEQSLRYASSLP